jgi:deoxyribodipyrimidine photo-lyase
LSLDRLDHEPTRAAALARLGAFLPHAGRDYAESRNFDLGPDRRGNVSGLSPWIRHRVLTETEIFSAVIARHGEKAADKFIQEILWRGYFKGWLEHRPEVWLRYRTGVEQALETLDRQGGMRRDYEAAIGGRSGVACFDGWRDELVETGWLHNHARMWFASIWIFTLRLPWQLGADFFLRHLLDGDPASNTLSWRWVGGLHTRGKTYQATAENIARFTDGRFNPAGELSDRAEPLPEDDLPDPQLPPLPPLKRPDSDYALVLTEDDLDLAAWSGRPPAAVLILAATRHRSPLDTSQIVTAFDKGLQADIAARIEADWGCPVWCADNATEAADMADWLSDQQIARIVMHTMPTGPARDRWQPILDTLAASGIEKISGHRDYDAALWPHAAKGFFKVKKAAPDILAQARL